MSEAVQPWYATGDRWIMNQTESLPGKVNYFETVFTQSNGYFGVRGYTEERSPAEGSCREAYLAGVFGEVDDAAKAQIKTPYPWPLYCMLSLPELFACEIELDGERFRPDEGTLEFHNRSLDLRNAVLSRHLVWTSPAGRRTRLHFDRFLSADIPHLAMQHISLVAENWRGPVRFHFALDASTPSYFRCGDRSFPHLPQALIEEPEASVGDGGVLALAFRVRGTGHRVAIVAETDMPAACDAAMPRVAQTVDVTLETGVNLSLHRAVAVVCTRDGFDAGDLVPQARAVAGDALAKGYAQCLSESEAHWSARWSIADLELDGPARDQVYLRYGTFSQLQMAPFHSDALSIPARAYAYNRYHGLYYWDSETFLLPQLLHTFPHVAENLLSFRHRTLDGARRTAARLGSSGACYPWMTDADSGTEQAPWGIGDYVWHQNADIAHAIDQYVRATGDTGFMRQKGLEMLLETARFWMSRFERDADGVVHLHDTVGPDELDKHGRDNGYTSLMARHHLRLAVHWLRELEVPALCDRLGVDDAEVAAWSAAARDLAVPGVPGHSFPLQDEFLLAKAPLSFEGMTADEAFALRHTHRVVKQADIVLAMFLLAEEFSTGQMRDAYDLYEPMTLHYSSLSYNTHSILASQIDRPAQAYDYFLKAAGLDLDNLRDATRDGLHAAALGGTWQTVVYGFLGMRLDAEGLVFTPRLPEAWNRLCLRIAYRGHTVHLDLSHQQQRIHVDLRPDAGPIHVTLNGVRKTYSPQD